MEEESGRRLEKGGGGKHIKITAMVLPPPLIFLL